MRFRNKQTGVVREARIANGHLQLWSEVTEQWFDYDDIDFFAKHWERHEEPKEYWFINDLDGTPMKCELHDSSVRDFEVWSEKRKRIGNWFATEEEAEKAAKKIEAWTRLVDKGFKFTGISGVSNYIFVSFEADDKYKFGRIMYDESSNTDNNLREYNEDLTLLFGG